MPIKRNQSFFDMDKEFVLQHLETQVSGLSEREASDRLHRLGPNTIESEKKISLLHRIVNQQKNVMVLILTVAAAIALLVGDVKSTLIVVAVIVMNTILGVAQESKAELLLNIEKCSVYARVSPEHVTQLKWQEWLITIVASLMIIPLVDLQKWATAKFRIRKNL